MQGISFLICSLQAVTRTKVVQFPGRQMMSLGNIGLSDIGRILGILGKIRGTFTSYATLIMHYDDVIMDWIASQITSLPVVCSIVYSDVNQRKHQSSASLAFVREIHRGPVNFPHKWPVTRKMFPFDDVIMEHVRRGMNPLSCSSYEPLPSGIMLTLLCHIYWNTHIFFSFFYTEITQVPSSL